MVVLVQCLVAAVATDVSDAAAVAVAEVPLSQSFQFGCVCCVPCCMRVLCVVPCSRIGIHSFDDGILLERCAEWAQ